MKKQSTTTYNLRRFFSAVVLLAVAFAPLLQTNSAYAAQITARSVTLIASGTTGGSKAGGTVNHRFDFTLPSGGSVGSIKFEYCTTAADVGALVCVAPTGLNAATVTLGGESGVTGMSMSGRTANSFYLARGSAFALASNTTVTYTINGVTNPTDNNKTFFMRISAYTSLDTTGVAIHKGTVAASTAEPIILDGTMPESLVFCTGETVGLTASVPDCGTATSGVIHFNQLFSPTDTATSKSQMAASTNAGSGYAITVNGPTLTSGANTITGMSPTDVSKHGISQFGLNLKANTVLTSTTPVGSEIAPTSNGTNYRGQAVPASGYDTVDSFRFVSGEVVGNSANGSAGGTDAQIYTVSYIANVPGSLPAGTYTSTLTYICTPTY